MVTKNITVAPFAGAWIEIILQKPKKFNRRVAPFAGAWIEIFIKKAVLAQLDFVAPFAGAWIEILAYIKMRTVKTCRSLRGSVD